MLDDTAERVRGLYRFRIDRFSARTDPDGDGKIEKRSMKYQRLRRELLEAERQRGGRAAQHGRDQRRGDAPRRARPRPRGLAAQLGKQFVKRPSHSSAASSTAARSDVRLWLPATRTTVLCAAVGGIPNGSPLPWITSVGTSTASSSASRLAVGADPARRGGRSGNARQSHADGAGDSGRAAGDARAGRAAAHDKRRLHDALVAQALDDGQPGGIELCCRRRRAATCHAVRLFDQNDADLLGLRSARHGNEVTRASHPLRPHGRARARRVGLQAIADAHAPGHAVSRSRRKGLAPCSA